MFWVLCFLVTGFKSISRESQFGEVKIWPPSTCLKWTIRQTTFAVSPPLSYPGDKQWWTLFLLFSQAPDTQSEETACGTSVFGGVLERLYIDLLHLWCFILGVCWSHRRSRFVGRTGQSGPCHGFTTKAHSHDSYGQGALVSKSVFSGQHTELELVNDSAEMDSWTSVLRGQRTEPWGEHGGLSSLLYCIVAVKSVCYHRQHLPMELGHTLIWYAPGCA